MVRACAFDDIPIDNLKNLLAWQGHSSDEMSIQQALGLLLRCIATCSPQDARNWLEERLESDPQLLDNDSCRPTLVEAKVKPHLLQQALDLRTKDGACGEGLLPALNKLNGSAKMEQWLHDPHTQQVAISLVVREGTTPERLAEALGNGDLPPPGGILEQLTSKKSGPELLRQATSAWPAASRRDLWKRMATITSDPSEAIQNAALAHDDS